MGNKGGKPATKPVKVLPNATASQRQQQKSGQTCTSITTCDSKTVVEQSSLQSNFIEACKIGDVDVAQKLLEDATVNVNQGTKTFGVTGLLYACQNGHLEIVTLLLNKARDTIDVNQTATTGIRASPLCIACSHGHAKIVTVLLKMGDKIDVNKSTETGGTALMIAADRGHEDIVAKLLNRPDIDCNKTWTRNDGRQFTPLERAADVGHNAIVELIRLHAESN